MYNIYNFKQTRTPDSQTEKKKKKKRKNTEGCLIVPQFLPWYLYHVAQFHTPLLHSLSVSSTPDPCLTSLVDGDGGIVKFNRIKPLYYSNAQNTLAVSIVVRIFSLSIVCSFFHSLDFILFFYNAQLRVCLCVY